MVEIMPSPIFPLVRVKVELVFWVPKYNQRRNDMEENRQRKHMPSKIGNVTINHCRTTVLFDHVVFFNPERKEYIESRNRDDKWSCRHEP